MEDKVKQYIKDTLKTSINIFNIIESDKIIHNEISDIVNACVKSLKLGGKILFAGNGGSAADAQHMAGEYVSRFAFDRPGMAAVSLATDTSILTAIGNDYGYDKVFARQVQAIGNAGDILMGYTTSGKSSNILNAFDVAKKNGIKSIAFTGGHGGSIVDKTDFIIQVPSTDTPRIQEAHAIIGHVICGLIEIEIFGKK